MIDFLQFGLQPLLSVALGISRDLQGDVSGQAADGPATAKILKVAPF
jgi:hypothetical protein